MKNRKSRKNIDKDEMFSRLMPTFPEKSSTESAFTVPPVPVSAHSYREEEDEDTIYTDAQTQEFLRRTGDTADFSIVHSVRLFRPEPLSKDAAEEK